MPVTDPMQGCNEGSSSPERVSELIFEAQPGRALQVLLPGVTGH